MRASTVIAVAATLMLAGCQETSTSTSDKAAATSTSSSSGGGSAQTSEQATGTSASATSTPAAGGETSGFDMSTDKSMEIAMPSGTSARLQYKDLKVGDGSIAESGKVAMVQYTGWLTDGTKFDSSYDHGQPFQFRIGEGGVIQGWDKGVQGMRVGGKRRLVIPSELGYGSRGAGGVIPPNATLVFEVELIGLK